MDFMEFLKSLFCCTFPKTKKAKKQTTSSTSVPEPPPPQKTVVELRREKMKIMWSLKTSWKYESKRSMILGRIAFDYENIVVVWCGRGYDPPRAAVSSTFHSFGDVSFIRDRWHGKERHLERSWRGALVEYYMKKEAMQASFDIPVQMTCLRATLMETIISQLTDCELLHPLYQQIPSKVVISRRIPLRIEEVSDLHDCLCTYGAIETFFVNNRISSLGMVCEVTYPYFTQAYLAMIMTDGQYFSGGILTATLEKTKKDVEILRETKECMFLLSQCRFPR